MATIEDGPARAQGVVGGSTESGEERALARFLRRGTAEVIHEGEFLALLRRTDRPLRVKFGVDPSSADLHLGHTVCFRKLREFQEMGHTVVIIIGDWTAQIGDPTGRSATRRMLTPAEVQANAATYTGQLFRVISHERVEVRYQSEWYGSFTLEGVFRLAARSTVAQMLAREDFRARFQAGQPIAVVELLYPLLQAYDSLAVDADIELGGLDQKFNLLMGRALQAAFGERPQQLVMMPLLVGTDGVQKMSKSLGNAIAIVEPPDEMFGKVMSLPDSALLQYVDLVTDLAEHEQRRIGEELAAGMVNPRDIKRRLGREIVAQFHDRAAAAAADDRFMRRFSRRELPGEIDEVRLVDGWFDRTVRLAALLVKVGFAASRGEARRLIAGGAIRLNGKKVAEATDVVTVEPGTVVQVSRRRFVRLVRERAT